MTESRLHRVVLLVADAWSLVVELPAEGIHRGPRSRTQLFFDADVAHGLRVVEARNVRSQHAGDTSIPTPAAFEVTLELENADRAGRGWSGVKVDLPVAATELDLQISQRPPPDSAEARNLGEIVRGEIVKPAFACLDARVADQVATEVALKLHLLGEVVVARGEGVGTSRHTGREWSAPHLVGVRIKARSTQRDVEHEGIREFVPVVRLGLEPIRLNEI